MTNPASWLLLRFCFLRKSWGLSSLNCLPLHFSSQRPVLWALPQSWFGPQQSGSDKQASLCWGCLSQQYEMTWGDRSVLSPLPCTLLFHQTKSANPSVSSSFMILKSIFLIFHRYSKHKSFEWHKNQCKLPVIHIVWKSIAKFLYMSACKVILVMPDSVRPHGL